MAQLHRVRREEAWNVLHTPAIVRVGVASLLGCVTGCIAFRWVRWEFAALVWWDTVALTVLLAVWPLIVTFDSRQAYADAKTEFVTRITEQALADGLP